jgi:hypothetical protein
MGPVFLILQLRLASFYNSKLSCSLFQHKFCKSYFNVDWIGGKLLFSPQRRLCNRNRGGVVYRIIFVIFLIRSSLTISSHLTILENFTYEK